MRPQREVEVQADPEKTAAPPELAERSMHDRVELLIATIKENREELLQVYIYIYIAI